jgi:L,D-transpeptidase catalytic domain
VPKKYLPIAAICLLSTFLLLPVVKAGKTSRSFCTAVPEKLVKSAISEKAIEFTSNLIYDSLNLKALGLSREALVYAYRGQQALARKGKLENAHILTVCDFSQPSTSKRMYIIDIKNFKVLLNTYVAHGRNSGLEYASRFSNGMKSLQSSLGFYITGNTYFGKNGLSLRLTGLEKGFNDKAQARAVVVHGAPYIGEQRADAAYMGRSFGCPAVPEKLAATVINLIKDGTCLFIYHPTKKYLLHSRILNG